MTSRFSPEEVSEIKQLRNKGWTYKRLMNKYECSAGSLQNVLGITRKMTTRRSEQLSEDEIQKIIELRKKGLMYTQIQKLIDNVSAHTVRKVIKENNT